MNEQLIESMSAVIDGQADDMEVRRLLKALETASDEEASTLLAQWERFQTIGAALRGDQSDLMASSGFAAKVSAAIADETVDDIQQAAPAADLSKGTSTQEPRVKAEPIWRRLAVAATVAFAVIVGVQEYGSFAGGDNPAAGHSLIADNNATDNTLINKAAVSDNNAIQTLVASAELVNSESSVSTTTQLETAEAQQRLNEYLLQHTSHAAQQGGQGMIPFARLANFEEE